MDINEFWKIVDEINWSSVTRGYDSDVMKRDIINKYGIEKALELRPIYYDMTAPLYDVLWDVEGIGLSDDGYSDLIAHIVGCGREVYEATLADTSLAVKRAQSGDYVENFSYILPYDDDNDKGDDSKYKQWAIRSIEEMDGTDWDEVPAKDVKEIETIYARLRAICVHVIHGEHQQAVDLGEKVADDIRRLNEFKCRDAANLLWGYAIPNMVNDINIWVLGNDNKAGY